jgi:hypothetical protein
MNSTVVCLDKQTLESAARSQKTHTQILDAIYHLIIFLCAYSWYNPALSTVHYYHDSDLFNTAHTSTPRGAYIENN